MFGPPKNDIKPNTAEYESLPLISPNGFREYDARWLYEKEINLIGIQALGLALGDYFHERGIEPKVVVGHDYRSYSVTIKQALTLGLMSAGCAVHDIGLALSPVAYFAQFALDAPAVAMVTASHNENGWTGVKMGAARPLTFGPDEINRLKQIVFEASAKPRPGGSYTRVKDMRETYLAEVTRGHRLSRRIRVVAACGNGTAGAFAPEALQRIGADVVPMDTTLDWNFPKYNPNPEDMEMLRAMGGAVKESGAELALGFDGDGDRCGVVDDHGHEIFADKVGVLLARDLSSRIPNAKFVVDVKSTGHYFFNPPIGRGYDDSIVAAIAVLEMLDRAGSRRISELINDLPKTWGSPTMAPYCPDERKYQVVDSVTKEYEQLAAKGEKLLGQKIARLVTVNGVRVTLEDGTWGLVRASSNKPSLVVVCESPVSDERMRAMFREVDARLQKYPEVGEYDQKI